MIDTTSLWTFILASLVLLIVPGPAVLYIIAKSADQGRRAGIISVLGIETGTLVHTIAAAAGLSAILMASSVAFSVLKFAGAGYLIFLGLKKIFGSRQVAVAQTETAPQSSTQIYWQGVVVNVLNPKTCMFFFAFLPQFINPAKGHVALQVLILGLIFSAMATISDGAYALAAGSLGRLVKNNRYYIRMQSVITGIIYIGLGLMTVFVQPTHKK